MPALDTLTFAYRAIHRLPAEAPLPGSAAAQIQIMAQGIEAARAGQPGFGWTLDSAMQWVFDSARGTTQVAALSYGFFAELSVGTAGLDYLVSATGPNPNNLNSAYYEGFTLENRYINFAVNLVKHGDARSKFVAEYGAEATMHQTLRMAWLKLFGVDKPLGEIVDLLSSEVPDGRGGMFTRGEYFVALGGDGGNGLGSRAAAVGWLLAEAAKAGRGPYSEAVEAFLKHLALDGRSTPTNVFLSQYGPGGDHALGGAGDPGYRGERIRFEHDWSIDVTVSPTDPSVQALATDGNDSLVSAVSEVGGLDAGRRIATGDGNDTIMSANGVMRGAIDGGAGNDAIFVEKFEGQITTGAGFDMVDVGSFGALKVLGGAVGEIATITDFRDGSDLVQFARALGSGKMLSINFFSLPTFAEALAAYAAQTAANENGVFEWGGDTYIFHQNGIAGLDAGDGLIRLAGVIGLTIANGPEARGDILFGA